MPEPKIDIEYVAKLARIALTDEEKQAYSKQLSQVINYFNMLDEVDVTDIEPMAHAFPLVDVLQDDKEGPTLSPEEALANAPAQKEQQVVVPRIVE